MTEGPGGLRIGIDGRTLESPRTGVGRYVFELCRALDACLPDAKFFVYARRPVELPVDSPRWTMRVEPWAPARRLRAIGWLKTRVARLAREDGLTVFWAAAALLPARVLGVPTVLTVFDLNVRVVPETMTAAHRWALRVLMPRDVRRADRVTAISVGTAERLRTWLGPREVTVVRPAVADGFSAPTPTAQQRARDRYDLGGPFFLAVGTWEPRKNLALLVEAFTRGVADGSLRGQQLALAGGRGWKDTALASRVRDAAAHGTVVPLGYVPDCDLPALYAAATAFVFPSRYEGFGIPVLEARAAGAVIVASDLAEVREAGGTEATYVMPRLAELRAALAAAARGSLPRSRDRRPPWSWTESARTLAGVLQEAAAGPGSSRRVERGVVPGAGDTRQDPGTFPRG